MLQFLITLGGISLAMSVVIILMLAMQRPIKKRFAALGRYIIWSVIIVRLCLPVSLDILPKLITLPSVLPETQTVMPSEEVYEGTTPEVNYTPEAQAPSEPSTEAVNEPMLDNTESEISTPVAPVAPTPAPAADKPGFELTGEHIIIALFTVWALGAVGFVTFTLIRYRINARRLDEALALPDPELWGIYDTVCRELNIKKAPPLYMGRADVSPMVYGFFNPKVVLPSVEMSAESVTYILRHELTHYKRGDLWFKLLAMLANALHWFNPLAYIACGAMSAEAELSCDESALRKTDLMGRLGYGNSMLEIVKRCKHSPKLTTGFSPKKRAVKERFENMINTTKKRKGYLIVALIVAAALICTSLIGCGSSSSDFEITSLDTTDMTWEEIQQTRYDTGNFAVYSFDKENSESWKLERVNNKLVLTSKDGRNFAYTKVSVNQLLGVEYTYTNEAPEYNPVAYIAGDVGIITFSASEPESCGRVCMIVMDLNNGEIINCRTYTGEDILSLHSMTKDDLSIYNNDWYGDDWNYRVTVLMGNADYKDKGRIIMQPYIEARDGTAECEIYYDIADNRFSETEKGYCNIEKGRYITEIEGLKQLENLPEGGYECVRAFLEKDTGKLESMAGYPEGLLESYKEFEFGKYLLSLSDKGVLSLLVEIEHSPVDWIKPGKRAFTYINDSAKGIRYMIDGGVTVTQEPVEYEWPVNEAIRFVDRWITYANEPLIPYGDQYSEEQYAGVMYILNIDYYAKSLEDYRREAERVFGIDLFTDVYADDGAVLDEIEELNFYTNGNSYKPYFPHETVDTGYSYVVLQFYADHGKTVPAYKIRYNFALDDERIVSRGCEKFDDTGRDIRQLYSENEVEIAE